MPARVDDQKLLEAAEALYDAARSMTTEAGLKIHVQMDAHQAKSAVLAALVAALGYPNAVMPTGWTEVDQKIDLGKLR